jgi:hypothetical protein
MSAGGLRRRTASTIDGTSSRRTTSRMLDTSRV